MKYNKKYPTINQIDYASAFKAKEMAANWVESMKALADKWFDNPLDKAKINRKLTGIKLSNVKVVDGLIAIKVK